MTKREAVRRDRSVTSSFPLVTFRSSHPGIMSQKRAGEDVRKRDDREQEQRKEKKYKRKERQREGLGTGWMPFSPFHHSSPHSSLVLDQELRWWGTVVSKGNGKKERISSIYFPSFLLFTIIYMSSHGKDDGEKRWKRYGNYNDRKGKGERSIPSSLTPFLFLYHLLSVAHPILFGGVREDGKEQWRAKRIFTHIISSLLCITCPPLTVLPVPFTHSFHSVPGIACRIR